MSAKRKAEADDKDARDDTATAAVAVVVPDNTRGTDAWRGWSPAEPVDRTRRDTATLRVIIDTSMYDSAFMQVHGVLDLIVSYVAEPDQFACVVENTQRAVFPRYYVDSGVRIRYDIHIDHELQRAWVQEIHEPESPVAYHGNYDGDDHDEEDDKPGMSDARRDEIINRRPNTYQNSYVPPSKTFEFFRVFVAVEIWENRTPTVPLCPSVLFDLGNGMAIEFSHAHVARSFRLRQYDTWKHEGCLDEQKQVLVLKGSSVKEEILGYYHTPTANGDLIRTANLAISQELVCVHKFCATADAHKTASLFKWFHDRQFCDPYGMKDGNWTDGCV